MSYELHPLCTLFPRVTGAEFDALVADIKANGLRNPIVVHDGMILDGGNRYRACLEIGMPPEFVEFSGGSAVSFVLSANLHRRHLTPGQQAAIVASAQDWAQAQGRGGDRKSDQSQSIDFDSVAKRAAASGASRITQMKADKVAKADPELAKKVAHGEVSLPKALQEVEGKKPVKPKKAEKTEATPAPAPAAMVAPDGTVIEADDMVDLAQVCRELQAENESLRRQIESIEASDPKAEALRWRIAHEHAMRRQNELMDDAARIQRTLDMARKDLSAIGRAIGELDHTKVVRAVQAFVRAHKAEAA